MVIDSNEVVKQVKFLHYREQDFYDGNIQEMIQTHDKYELKEVELSEISKVYTEIYGDLVEEYEELETEIPPIILSKYDDGSYLTIDGGHRITVARNKGLTSIMAYVGIGEPNYDDVESDED